VRATLVELPKSIDPRLMATRVSSVAPVLFCRGVQLSLTKPCVMGILNVTPDSFSDGGRFVRSGRIDVGAVVAAARDMIDAGAAIIDVGGESTRPGALPVDEDEELRRVIPVVEHLAQLDTIISVDTSKAAVARSALDAGAHLINDVRALSSPELRAVVADSDAAVCLMHMRGEPRTMQQSPAYIDVVAEVQAYLEQRALQCEAAGIARERIMLDPGFGFGKTLDHNLMLLRRLSDIVSLGYPVMAGLSRKGMLGTLTGRSADARVAGSVAAAVVAVQNGARIVRVHDVGPTVDALKVVDAVMEI
jgi:dihydropteroate synthase